MATFDLTGRTVLVAGASSGIGAHLAFRLAEAGANVVLGARRTDLTSKLVKELDQAGRRALAVTMDVTDESSVMAAYDAAEAEFGTVQSVIANAGMAAPGRSTDLPLEKARQVIETNYVGTYTVAREGARRMIASGSRERQDGRIVMISSMTALLSGAGDTAYSSSKAAVNHLGRTFAREWARHGINVNVICPGYLATDMTGDWLASEQGKAYVATFVRNRLLPLAALDDMVLYFASDASRYVTGAQMLIDDGQSF